jgi:hypothetical protein
VKRRIELQADSDNILELKQPEQYRCRVVGYILERSLLVVEVAEAIPVFYVVFPEVHAYNGSFLWRGAELRVATQEEQFEYMLDKSVVMASGLLFEFKGEDHPVHILAGDWIAVFDDLPDRFK